VATPRGFGSIVWSQLALYYGAMNPFHYSTPVPPDELVDREEEANKLLTWGREGNNSRLAAPRRYGKTSLLKRVLADAAGAGGQLGVFVDFFGVVSLADVAERIERAYVQALLGPLARWFDGVRRSWRPVVSAGVPGVSVGAEGAARGQASLLERLALPRRVAERSGLRVLVVFDEFQDVLTAGPQIDAVIRSEIQHHAEVASYIFAGSQVGMMNELFGDPRRAFYAQARPMALSPLPLEPTAEFIAARFQRTGRDVGRGLGPLLDVAVGHPQRTMLLAHQLWEVTPQGAAADEEMFAMALDQSLIEATSEITVLWSRLTASERRLLARIAEDAQRLYARDAEGSRGAAISSTLDKLRRTSEVVEDTSAVSGWRLVDPLFAAWIRRGRAQA
jgi:hypothetical protein